jgi:hypothetical protein
MQLRNQERMKQGTRTRECQQVAYMKFRQQPGGYCIEDSIQMI